MYRNYLWKCWYVHTNAVNLGGNIEYTTKVLRLPFYATSEMLSLTLEMEFSQATHPQPQSLQFGSCGVHKSLKKHLRIKNNSSELSVYFHFSKVAHFTFKPPRGSIGPATMREILVTFNPHQLGVLTSEAILTVSGEHSTVLKTMPLKMIGNSLQIDKSRENSTTQLQFIEFGHLSGHSRDLDYQNTTKSQANYELQCKAIWLRIIVLVIRSKSTEIWKCLHEYTNN